jgi:hypothetical protein
MSDEQQTGLQVVNGEEVVLEPKKKSRKSKAEKLDAALGGEKKKRQHVWTDKTRAAFEKCRAARLANIEKRKAEKQQEQASVPVEIADAQV